MEYIAPVTLVAAPAPANAEPVNAEVAKIMRLIAEGKRVRPKVEAHSFADVYEAVVRVFGFEGHPGTGKTLDDVLQNSFSFWKQSLVWAQMRDPGYLYPLYKVVPELVCFKKYLESPTASFKALLEPTPYYKSHPDMYLEALMWFSTLRFETLYDGLDRNIQRQIAKMTKLRDTAWEAFLLDPCDPTWRQLVTKTGGGDAWLCDKLACIPKPANGQPVVVDEGVLRQRFNEFSLGMFAESPNPNCQTPFPWANVVIAGGSISKCLDPSYNPKKMHGADIDIFVYGSSSAECAQAVDRVIDWFNTGTEPQNRVYYAVKSSVVNIYLTGRARTLQVISANNANPYDVLSGFDLAYLQCAIDDKRVYMTAGALEAFRSRVTTMACPAKCKPDRMMKALYYGFDLARPVGTQRADCTVDITPYVDDPEGDETKRMLRGMHSWFYPTYSPDMDADDNHRHNCAMIEADSKTTIVTSDPARVAKSIVICGDFSRSYNTATVVGFNPATIEAHRHPRVQFEQTLKTTLGQQLRLATGKLTVAEVKTGNDGVRIVAECSHAFEQFCDTLEKNTFMVFAGRPVTRSLVTERRVTFEIPRSMIVIQEETGRALMKDQRGNGLNIEEDLAPGHEIDLTINVLIHASGQGGDNYVKLVPKTIVRYNPATTEETDLDDEEPEDDIPVAPGSDQFADEISYDC